MNDIFGTPRTRSPLPLLSAARDAEGSLRLFLPGYTVRVVVSPGDPLFEVAQNALRSGQGMFLSVPSEAQVSDTAVGTLVQFSPVGPTPQGWELKLRGVERVEVEVMGLFDDTAVAGHSPIADASGPDLVKKVAQARALVDGSPLPDTIKTQVAALDDNNFANAFAQLALEGSLDDAAKLEVVATADPSRRVEIGLAAFTVTVERMLAENPMLGLIQEIKSKPLPEQLRTRVGREIKQLEQMPPGNPERRGVEEWLRLVADLPWGQRATPPTKSLAESRAILDKNHRGMEETKQRIIRQLAQLKRRGERFDSMSAEERSAAIANQQYILLVGPKGTGKTSIMSSIAEARGAELRLIDVGSLSGANELNGFARTYVGSRPGKIFGEVAAAGSKNIVLGLDEIDKLKSGGQNGDPYSVLLSLTDPSRNRTFTDLFADFPFDMSDVGIIATANDLSSIPETLLDRFSIVQLRGYSPHEKLDAVHSHILKRVYRDAETTPDRVQITDDGIMRIIDAHTYESGMRGLTDKLTTVFLEAELQMEFAREAGTEMPSLPIVIDSAFVDRSLPHGMSTDTVPLNGPAGYGTWMYVKGNLGIGGLGAAEVLQYSSGGGKLILTGSVKDGIRESAQAALGWIMEHREALGIESEFAFEGHDYQINYGEIGVEKDGPSAGAATTVMLVSKFLNTPSAAGLTMTGTIEPGGRIGQIGGVVEKVLGAHRAGITQILIPKANEPDIADIPEDVRAAVTITPVANIEEALALAFPGHEFAFGEPQQQQRAVERDPISI